MSYNIPKQYLELDSTSVLSAGTGVDLHLYNSDDGAGNYERLEIKWDTNVATIATTAAGTGTAQSLRVGGDGFIYLADNTGDFFVSTNGVPRWYSTMRPHQPSTINSGSNTTRWLNTYTKNLYVGDTSVDTVLTADADNQLALRNSTNAQQFNIYNTYTDASNYERLEVKWDTNEAQVATTKGGTGQFRGVYTGILDGSTKRQGFLMDSTLVSSYWSLGSQCYIFSSTAFRPNGSRTLGNSSNRWSNTYTDKITIGDGTDAILNGDGTGKIYMGNDSSQFTQFAVRGEDDGAGNYNQLEMRMASNGACGLYSTGYGTQTPSGLKIYHNGVATFEFTATQLYVHQPFRPTSAGSESIGTPSIPFGSLYINSSSKIYFNNSQLLGSTGGSGIVLEQRNGTTEQRYYLYNTYTDGNNYERLEIKWDANEAIIRPTYTGTGTYRTISMQSAITNRGKIEIGFAGTPTIKWGNAIGFEMQNTDRAMTRVPFAPNTAISGITLGQDTRRWETTFTQGIATDVETFTATDTLDDQNQVCLCNATTGNITLNLPVASSTPSGTQYQIKKIDSSSNTVIITPNSGAGDLIDGSTTYTLSNQWEGVIIVCDGGDWYVTGGVTNSGGGCGGGGGLGGGD